MANKEMFQPLVLAAILAAGLAVVWGLASMWAMEVGAYVAGAYPGSEQLLFLADGTARVAHDGGEHGGRQYRDLDGRPVPSPENDDFGWLVMSSLPAALPSGGQAGEVSWSQRIRSFTDGRAPATYWYFMTDGRPGGTGYFVGYDSQSRQCVGYLGTGGFREAPPPAGELFPFGGLTSGPGSRVLCAQGDNAPTEHPVHRPGGRAPQGSASAWDVYVVGHDSKIYHADLHSRTVQVALDKPRLRSAALVAGMPEPVLGTPYRLAARTDDTVLVLDERGRVRKRYPIPELLRGQELAFAETTAGEALLYSHKPPGMLDTEVEYRIYWIAPAGRSREARVTLPWHDGMRPLRTFGGMVMPAPVVVGSFVAFLRPAGLLEQGVAATYPEALRRALLELWPALLLAQLLAAGLAVLCYRRQVRYGASRGERLVWSLFVLAFGLPGWLAYRFGRSWPVLESCPACDAAVPRDRGCCGHCEAEFPRPALKGTEVFA